MTEILRSTYEICNSMFEIIIKVNEVDRVMNEILHVVLEIDRVMREILHVICEIDRIICEIDVAVQYMGNVVDYRYFIIHYILRYYPCIYLTSFIDVFVFALVPAGNTLFLLRSHQLTDGA